MFEVDHHMFKNRHEFEFPGKIVAVAKLAKIGQHYTMIAGKYISNPLAFLHTCIGLLNQFSDRTFFSYGEIPVNRQVVIF